MPTSTYAYRSYPAAVRYVDPQRMIPVPASGRTRGLGLLDASVVSAYGRTDPTLPFVVETVDAECAVATRRTAADATAIRTT